MDPADRLALITLAARYAQAVDRRDVTAVAALCAADVLLILPAELNRTRAPAELRGRETVARTVVDAVSHLVATRHVVEQQVARSDTTGRAYGETYCTAHHIYARGAGHRDNRIALRYQDVFECRDGLWLFSSRELVVDFAEDVPVSRTAR